MIIPTFSLTATERVLPKLALDFTTASLDSRITFTRTTGASNPATYTNSSGVITAATNDQPRFDYDPVTLTCKGLLIEESRTNLTLQSESFNNSYWTKTNTTIASDTEIAPNGTLTGDKLIEGTGVNQFYIARNINPIINTTTYTLSIYAKAAGRNWLALYWGSPGAFAYFDLENGVLGSTTNGATSAITSVGNGWYRCSITKASNNTNVTVEIHTASANNTYTYTGDGTSGIYIWGAQLEAGAFATSYIPTTSAALTRNADVATMTGTNFSSWWTTTTGGASVYATQKTISGTRPLFQVDDNTSSNQICLRGNGANPELYIKATTDQVQIDAGTIVANTAYKFAGAWNTNNCAAAQNGGAVVTDTSATIPTVTQARIGCDGTNYANAWLQKINYWQQRITNNEVQAFSK